MVPSYLLGLGSSDSELLEAATKLSWALFR